MAALPLLNPDFRGYAHYFYENKLKEAVAAAFERYENKLNELRDDRGSMMGGALGWIRNPYEHEKHTLPDPTASEALELLFVASYLMRMLELSIP